MTPAPFPRLKLAFFLTVSFMAVEAAGGFFANSLALVTDAAHMLMDSLALGVALFAGGVSRRGSDAKRTYGYRRMEVLSGLANGVLLIVVSAFIVQESVQRLRSPADVDGLSMSVVAGVGLVVNAAVLVVLHPVRRVGFHVRGAVLHVMGDFLGSVAALAAGILIVAFGWRVMDPIAGLLVVLLILAGTVRLMKEAFHILLEGTPGGIDAERLKGEISSVEDVQEVHDVHVWTIGTGFDILTAHVVTGRAANGRRVRVEIENLVRDRFGIRHVTIQVEEQAGDPCVLRPGRKDGTA